MPTYIDGFLFPLNKQDLPQYQNIAEQVAAIWKEYGAIAYHEFVGDDLSLEGTRSFTEALTPNASEVIIFGWVLFPSKEIRDKANKAVPQDPRMTELVAPIMNPEKLIFDASKMFYGGFKALVELQE